MTNSNNIQEAEVFYSQNSSGLNEKTLKRFQVQSLSMGNQFLANTNKPMAQAVGRRFTSITIYLDRSGSMLKNRRNVTEGLNEGLIDDLQHPHNVDRNSQFLTIWEVYENHVTPLKVFDPKTNGYIEVIEIPVMDMPKLRLEDYRPDGGTPLNKGIMMGLNYSWLHSERMAAGMNGMKRRYAENLGIALTDGQNTLFEELLVINGKPELISYADSEVKHLVDDLVSKESRWQLIYARVANDNKTTKSYADAIGFPKYVTIGAKNDNINDCNIALAVGRELTWRSIFNFASEVSQAVSQAVSSGMNSSQSQAFSNPFAQP